MTIGEQLREKQKQQDKGKKKEEKIDWKELMGQYAPVYKRGKGGAIRRK